MTTHRQFGKQGHPRIYLWAGDKMESQIDLGGDCLAFNAQASLTSPVGTWSVTLLPRTGENQTPADVKRLTKLYKSDILNKVVSIGFDVDGGIMLGLVGSVQESWSISRNGSISRSLTLSGQNFGKVLIRDNIINVLWSDTTPEQANYISAVESYFGADCPLLQYFKAPTNTADPSKSGFFEGKTIQEVASWMLTGLTVMQIPLLADVMGTGSKAGNYMDATIYVSSFAADRVWAKTLDLATYQGNAWGFLQSLIDVDFYEAWVETIPNPGSPLPLPYLVIRPKPFDEPDFDMALTSNEPGLGWNDLRTIVYGNENHDIELDEIFSASFSMSEDDAFGHYNVWSAHSPTGYDGGANEALSYPVTDLYSVARFGLRQMKSSLNLVGGDLSAWDSKFLYGEITIARNRLVNWYRFNPWMEEGQLTVAGRDDFRAGDPVRLPWREAPFGDEKGMRYYCVGVSWSWQRGGQYTSTLRLTRGHNADMIATLRDMVGKGSPLTAVANLAGIGVESTEAVNPNSATV